MLPFSENVIEENEEYCLVKREFSIDLNNEDLYWHRDKEDREIHVLHGKEWYLQIDEELPRLLHVNSKMFIPKNTWHRLISKNRSNLIINVKKFQDES